jgi:hypothetical protein
MLGIRDSRFIGETLTIAGAGIFSHLLMQYLDDYRYGLSYIRDKQGITSPLSSTFTVVVAY